MPVIARGLWAVTIVCGVPLLPLSCSASAAAPSVGFDGGAATLAVDAASAAATAVCVGDPCLHGSVSTSGFSVPLASATAFLYDVFPSGSATPAAMQTVALDGTWAFGGISGASAHYFIEVAARFDAAGQPPGQVAAIVGPLTAPFAEDVIVVVKPVQIEAVELRTTNGPLQLQWASAHVFDPQSGAEIPGAEIDGGPLDDAAVRATVALAVGDASVPLPWDKAACGVPAYCITFPMPPPSQSSYAVTTTLAGSQYPSDAGSAQWNLTADPPSFVGAITSPEAGIALQGSSSGGAADLQVTWVPEPADFVTVTLFEDQTPSGPTSTWTTVYASPAPQDPSTTEAVIPGQDVADAGDYLLNVQYSKANCPSAADGCVVSSMVADTLFTVR